MCRFSDAGNDDLTTRSGNRRPKSAKATKSREVGLGRPCRKLSYGDLGGERAASDGRARREVERLCGVKRVRAFAETAWEPEERWLSANL